MEKEHIFLFLHPVLMAQDRLAYIASKIKKKELCEKSNIKIN
jgi:hypothetical protein